MNLKFKKLHENALLPVHATEDAAGLDLYACLDEPVILHPGEAAAVPTGIAMELPKGMEAQIRGRSGLAFKHAIFSYNGTIDADYRGEIKGLLINHSHVPFVIEPGMRICQMVINASYVKCRPEFVEELNETVRGEGGFGSTGYGQADDALYLIDEPGFEDSKDTFAITEKAYSEDFYKKVDPVNKGYVPYSEIAGKKPPTRDEIMNSLMNVSLGKKNV